MPKGRVLVVDDEADLRKDIRLILTKADSDIVEAEDGEQAIAAIRSGDNPLAVSAVICDLVMPKVNGMEAIAYFRSQFPGVPILVLTGHPNIDNMTELYQQGVEDYLVKPIAPETLLAAVEKAMPKHKLFD
ncbi:response regulator [Nitrospiraceae bacterium AH_259_D15_M11_P09]|nr:response regulator [Nitrospiraceae bacterium AH_259_D15_M11_P09]